MNRFVDGLGTCVIRPDVVEMNSFSPVAVRIFYVIVDFVEATDYFKGAFPRSGKGSSGSRDSSENEGTRFIRSVRGMFVERSISSF